MERDIYKALSLKVADSKGEPAVWVSRLAIYEELNPEPKLIRNIPLHRGLNIIWAEESEDDDPTVDITGHSAGKTTFCRLLRYVLGETTFGRKSNVRMIKACLPHGYVAAELRVWDEEQKRHRQWAVRRPIGGGRNSYVKEDATVEEIIADRSCPATLEDYPQKIGLAALVNRLDTVDIVRTGERILWGHLLAWCTRDQEARFQSVHSWRDPRSESDSPAFRFPKEGPLFVMRTALGLFLDQELKDEERLATLAEEKEDLEQQLEKQKREPDFRVNLYGEQLRKRLRDQLRDYAHVVDTATVFKADGELVPNSLEALKDLALKQLREELEASEAERDELQERIDDLVAEIREVREQLERIQVLRDLAAAKAGQLDETARKKAFLRSEDILKKNCGLVQIPLSECTHLADLRSRLSFSEGQDAHSREQNETDAAWQVKARDEQIKGINQRLGHLEEALRQAKRDRVDKNAGVAERTRRIESLEDVWNQFCLWLEKREQPGGYEELDQTRGYLAEKDKDIAATEKRLAKLLSDHDGCRKQLQDIFSASVRAVLASGAYDGVVGLDDRELSFQVTHGPAMTGEAVETLSVLLADMACLVYNSVSNRAGLPGLLLHDSPREADLSRRIYLSYLRFVGTLESHFYEPDSCPFQYIVTTTTAPPKEFRQTHVRAHLNAADSDGLLLRRNIATPPEADADQRALPLSP